MNMFLKNCLSSSVFVINIWNIFAPTCNSEKSVPRLDIWSFEVLCKLNCNLSFNMLLDIAIYSIKDIFELNCNNIFFSKFISCKFIHCFIKNNYMSNGKKNAFFSMRERERENCPNTRYCNTVISVHPCRSSVLNRILLIFKRMVYPVIHTLYVSIIMKERVSKLT